ncbi:DUF3604 domain-containing protein [Moorena sp. SIO3B2]|uniref:DUF3604 domain-containing protein n=1 Tax=Moorena sp. SIO3B2 TaxID=2607827 RepID=UPI0013CAC7BC|nr:DUF3604 domain-containing protein [Moorena sp. SIO3B2]NEP34762.1 DUF3604 domain-containing protein [Moorena sp. SIO3B2]
MLRKIKGFGKRLIIGLMTMLLFVSFGTTAQAVTLEPAVDLTGEISCDGESLSDPAQRQALFGDLHTHTTYSLDAYMGFMRNDPDAAYKFAKGEPNEVPGGITQHKVPLDFAAVTDHAEFLGEMEMALNPEYGPKKYYNPYAIAIRNKPESETLSALVFVKVVQGATRGDDPQHTKYYGAGPIAEEARKNAWKKIQQATEDNYEPGTFTTLHAFEWSSAPGGANLHRNVIFRDTVPTDDKGNVLPSVLPEDPVSAFETQSPEELWQYLSQYEDNGATVLAIPHNGNASANMMFMPEQFDGKEIDPAWAEMRAKYEPLVEIMQIKGTSETLPAYAPEDQFADFELMEISERTRGRYGYLREALKNGLRHEEKLGSNPFKFGIVGATDNHNGSPGDTEEDDYIGSHGYTDATPALRQFSEIPGWEKLPYLNPGALTGVWADQNTRECVYDGLARKETFGTSGTRTQVRFFGGWDFPDDLDQQPDAVDQAYATGVPMGKDLPTALEQKAPKFFVWATKDSNSGNLDRIQVVKGWTKDGLTYEKIYDVAWAGDRELDPTTGKLPPIGSTVDVYNATYTNDIGSPELSGVWQDPDFDPTVRAFYYLRALEIPTPRYSTRDAAELGIVPSSPTEIQERAWSSPIWYTPSDAYLAAGEVGALTVDQLEQNGIPPLTTEEIEDLIRGHNLEISNRITGEEFIGFFQDYEYYEVKPDKLADKLDKDTLGTDEGTWFLGESASSAPLHTGELEAAAPMKYQIADNQLSFNLKDDSEFVAQLFNNNGQILAARNDEIGYVNYELTDLEEELDLYTGLPQDALDSLDMSNEDFWERVIKEIIRLTK